MDSDLTAFLTKNNFDKQLKKHIECFTNKKIIIYGAGKLFETIADNYNLSKLNIIGISDKKFKSISEKETFKGFKIISPKEILSNKPEIILIATLNYLSIIDTFKNITYRNTGIKFLPLVKKTFFELLNEIK